MVPVSAFVRMRLYCSDTDADIATIDREKTRSDDTNVADVIL